MKLYCGGLLIAAAHGAQAKSDEDFHVFETKGGQRRLAIKKRDVAGFYNHPLSTRRLAAGGNSANAPGKLQVNGNNAAAKASGVKVSNSATPYDIEVCNQTQDVQNLKWIPKNGPVVTLATMDPFSCKTASVIEGETLCFHNDKNFNKHECQKSALTLRQDGNIVFDPYKHYTELSDITGQREYHGVHSLDPDALYKYMNTEAVLENQVRYRQLTEGRTLTVVTTAEGQGAYRESPTEAGYHMWDSEYFGQEHTVTTSEGQELTLKSVSCSPRVFEIENFLADDEIQHIFDLAAEEGFNSLASKEDSHIKVSDVYRYDSTLMESIYGRVATVMNIDPEVLNLGPLIEADRGHKMQVHKCGKKAENQDEMPAEMPRLHSPEHNQRFASLVLFLNGDDQEVGGDLQFNRWEHLEDDDDILQIKAAKGKAVLVYNMLPDGNTDEFSRFQFTPMATGHRFISTIHISDDIVEKHVAFDPLPESPE